MRFWPLLIAGLLIGAICSVALAANDTEDKTLIRMSVNQNATISINKSTDVLMRLGQAGNATVYVSGGANATLMGTSLKVDMGNAPTMGYRDIYLYLEVPPDFANVTFDYDLTTGEKSNVMLVNFTNVTPVIGVVKGGIKDRAILGLGTWSSMYGEIGGLKPFPQGSHHVEIYPYGNQLVLKIDNTSGGLVADSGYMSGRYIVIHLMTGDENSYIRGTLSSLKYAGPPLTTATNWSGNATRFPTPDYTPTVLPSPVVSATTIPWSSPTEEDNGTTNGASKQMSGLVIYFAIAAAIGFILAWVYFYYKYLKR